MKRRLWSWVFCSLVAGVAFAHEAEVRIDYADGRREIRREPLPERNGVLEWRLDRASLRGPVSSVRVLPDFARAAYGESGYAVYPDGTTADFKDRGDNSTNKLWEASCLVAYCYGMKTPRATFFAIAKGMNLHAGLDLLATNREYQVALTFHEEMTPLYEEPSIEYHLFTDPKADYNEMAHAYREYQRRRHAMRPLRARAAERPALAYAMAAPEVRIRQAWKPVPSPIVRQVPQNEPPVKPVVPFAQVAKLARACKTAGVNAAEFCLVGWNKGGHDGAYPQLFPVEPSLGGEVALRHCIGAVQSLGYQIVAHGNHSDAYMIADSWDVEYLNERTPDGLLLPPECTWGGGGKYTICPRRAYERFAVKDAAMVAALGFKGLYYLDVLTCHGPHGCRDPRHALTRREAVKWCNAILDLQTDTFGGCASEGASDVYLDHFDSVLTANWGNPFPKERKPDAIFGEAVPFWELVYHGTLLYTPFRNIMNATANPDPRFMLKLAEFGGRPTFYVHSRFHSDNNAKMGARDLRATNDEELAFSVACIKRGYDEYARRSFLQNETMERHERVGEGLYRVTYSGGYRMLVNYRDRPTAIDGVTVPAMNYQIVGVGGKR